VSLASESVPLHSLCQLASQVIYVDLSRGGVVDDANEYVVQVVDLLLPATQLLEIICEPSLGQLELLILMSGFLESFLR